MTSDAGPPPGDVHVLSDLPGWDSDLGDPGRTWHPALDAYDDGTWLLPDLTADQVHEHLQKPEASQQIDGWQTRTGTQAHPLDAGCGER